MCHYVAAHAVCVCVCMTPPVWLCRFSPGLVPAHHNGMWMATERGRVVLQEQEELPTSGAATHAHTRSQSHIQIRPVTHTTQWPAPRALAHTRSHSHTHFSTLSQSQKYGCRLTHSLSAMAKGEKKIQPPPGKLNKPTEPLFPKTPQQVRANHLFFLFICIYIYYCQPCLLILVLVNKVWSQIGCEWLQMIGGRVCVCVLGGYWSLYPLISLRFISCIVCEF